MIGEYGYVPDLRSTKTKSDQRGLLVQYLYTIDDSHYKLLIPTSGQTLTALINNFCPYNPQFDLSLYYACPLPPAEILQPRVNAHHFIATEAHAVTTDYPLATPILSHTDSPETLMAPSIALPPKVLTTARSSLEAPEWEAAYNKELHTHDFFGTFAYIPRHDIPRNAKVARPVLTLRHKTDKLGHLLGHSALRVPR